MAGATPWVLSTYFAEGLPYSIVHQLSALLFTYLGASLGAVGRTSLYQFAWNAKFAWSPLVDRYKTPRAWLVGAELVLAALCFAIAIPAGRGDVPGVARLLVAFAVAAATHDIAIDGFYLHALDKGGQAALSGLRVAAYRAAMFVGSSLLVMLAGVTSWAWPFLVAGAAFVVLAVAHALFLPRVAPEGRGGQSGGARPPMVDAFVSFLRQPNMALSLPFIVLFKAGDALMFNMNAPFLKSLGFQALGSGALSGASTLASIVGTLVGGALLARGAFRRVLLPVAAMQSAAILLYVALASTAAPSTATITAVLVAEKLVAGFGDAALLVFIMRRCERTHRAAHFAIASALMSLPLSLVGLFAGELAGAVGFARFFLVAFGASLPGVALAAFVPKGDVND
ncbi:MAG TPA: MFS transporter [Minicystis sp.]|nr:MFS transporter [Minicystis sp.]